MKVKIAKIEHAKDEQVIIECVAVTPEIEEIQSYVLSKGKELIGKNDDKLYRFQLESVFYFEAVDEKTFAYTKDRVYELKLRLYQLEAAYEPYHFIRCSKSVVINLMKLESISPALNGRFYAHMKNNEKLMITRQYVSTLKNKIMGE